MAISARWAFRRSVRTAHADSAPLGWAEICHPFHPLRGQRFPVLKTRRLSGGETLILREPARGTVSVLREWTDWAQPSSVWSEPGTAPRRFALEPLLELVKLVEQLSRELDV